MPFIPPPFITKNKAIAETLIVSAPSISSFPFPFGCLMCIDSQVIVFTDSRVPSIKNRKFDGINFEVISVTGQTMLLEAVSFCIKNRFSQVKFKVGENEWLTREIELFKTLIPNDNIQWLPKIEFEFLKKEYFQLIDAHVHLIYQANTLIYAWLRQWYFFNFQSSLSNVRFEAVDYMKKLGIESPELYLLKNESIPSQNNGVLLSFNWRGNRYGFELGYQSTCWLGALSSKSNKKDVDLLVYYNKVLVALKKKVKSITMGLSITAWSENSMLDSTDYFTNNGWIVKRLDGKKLEESFALNNVYVIQMTCVHDNFPFYFSDIVKIGKTQSVCLSLGADSMLIFYE